VTHLVGESLDLLNFLQNLDPQALPAVLEAMKSNQEHPHPHFDRSICSLPKILKIHPVL